MGFASGRDRHRARRVREYVLLHLAEQITLEETRKALDMSASTIQRALRTTWGLSFHQLVERIRIERFLKMLAEDPDLKIEAHAPAVGWNGKANLYASVLRVAGCSLSSLRSDPALLMSVLAELSTSETYGQRRECPPGGLAS